MKIGAATTGVATGDAGVDPDGAVTVIASEADTPPTVTTSVCCPGTVSAGIRTVVAKAPDESV